LLSLEARGGAACLSRHTETTFLTIMLPMDMLNPAIVDIVPAGLPLSCTATGPELGLNEPEERFEGPLAINLDLVQREGPITVTGTLEGTAIRQCVRCLSDFSDPLTISLYAEFVRQPDEISKPSAVQGRKAAKRAPQPVEPVEELEEEDELYLYQGDHIDLVPMIREQIILAAPMQPLCGEGCLGLCPQCGQNLNERHCACPPAPGPSPFRVLRGRQSKGGNA
jgi:uncharacterized protein